MTDAERAPGDVAGSSGHELPDGNRSGNPGTEPKGETIEKRFHLWRLLAWLLGVMVALMGVAAAVNVWVLGF
jgi:hypothetical protein